MDFKPSYHVKKPPTKKSEGGVFDFSTHKGLANVQESYRREEKNSLTKIVIMVKTGAN